MTLVTAPAGYGKSTLAVDWCEDAEIPLAWLSLDRQDADPLALIGNIVGAIRRLYPDSLSEAAERLEAGAQPAGAAAVIAEVAAAVASEIDDLFVLALDDLHVLDDSPDALRVVDALVRATPMNMRLLLLSRTYPALGSLARLTAQRRVASLTVRDLVFSADEASGFLDASRVADVDLRNRLIQRADGWAAALAIMADHVSHEEGGGVGSEVEFIFGQFIDQEVLDRLNPQQHELLVACSVLPTFDREFAQSLSRNPQAGAVLRELEQNNRFLARLAESEAGEGEWYRVHALIREHLLQRMERDDPGRLQELRRQAAAICARRGLLSTAMDLSIAAGDWGEVVRELYDSREHLYQRGEWQTLAGWIDRLPPEVLTQEAGLALTRARLAAKFGQRQDSLTRLDRVEEQPLDAEEQVRVDLYRGVAFRDLGRIGDAIDAYRRARQAALEALPDDHPVLAEIDLEEGVTIARAGQFEAAQVRFETAAESFDRLKDYHRAAECRDCLGTALYMRGMLAPAMTEYTHAQRSWRQLADPQAQITTMNNMANVQHMLGELDTARDTFDTVVQRASQIGSHRHEAWGKEGLATVERDLGRLDNAITLYTVAIHEAQEIDDPRLIMEATYGLAMCYRERGEHTRARALLDHGLRSAQQVEALFEETRFRTGLGATFLSEGQAEQAVPILEEAIRGARESGAVREETIAAFILAGAHLATKKRPAANECLTSVRALTEQLGYDQFLLVEARQLNELVEYATARPEIGDYFRTIANRVRGATQVESDVAADLPSTFRIRAEAFGGARVEVGGRLVEDIEWRSERSKEMFFYLLDRGRPMRKEEIALELWPDAGPKQINSAFHTTLYRLRKAIHPQVVVQSAGGYRVNPEFDISYDANELEEAARESESAEPGSEEWAAGLSKVASLYRGPFASSFDSAWAEQARRRYEDMYLSSVLALASAALRRGDPAEAIRMAESVIATDPLNEDAAYRLMEAHVQQGNLELATRTYRRLHDALRDEMDSEPSPRVQTLYRRVLSGDALDDTL